MNYYPGMYQTPSYTANNQLAQNGLQWVQGEAGAKSFLVAPNSSVLLMDSEQSVFYLKSADQAGMPLPLRVFDYTERRATAPELAPTGISKPSEGEYVSREEFEALKSEYKGLVERLGSLETKRSKKESE